VVPELLGGLLWYPREIACNPLVVNFAFNSVLLGRIFVVHMHQLLRVLQFVVYVLDVLFKRLPDPVDFVPRQRADETQVLHVALLVDPVVP